MINGDGSFSRDFTHIQNVIDANVLALKTDNPLALNQVYNVACGESTTLKDLAEKVRYHVSLKNAEAVDVPIVFGEQRSGDIPHSLASIDKIKGLLGYTPQIMIDEGLRHSIDWYWNNI